MQLGTLLEEIRCRISARLPCRLIDCEKAEPYLERCYLGSALGRSAYLQGFLRSDADLGLHDHPWNRAISLVLTGGYDEQRRSQAIRIIFASGRSGPSA